MTERLVLATIPRLPQPSDIGTGSAIVHLALFRIDFEASSRKGFWHGSKGAGCRVAPWEAKERRAERGV
jgi:hypothetical protein